MVAPKAVHSVVVHHPGRLHEGIADRRSRRIEIRASSDPCSGHPTPMSGTGLAGISARNSSSAYRQRSTRRSDRSCRTPTERRGMPGRSLPPTQSSADCERSPHRQAACELCVHRTARFSRHRTGRKPDDNSRACGESSPSSARPARPRESGTQTGTRSSCSGTPHSVSWYSIIKRLRAQWHRRRPSLRGDSR